MTNLPLVAGQAQMPPRPVPSFCQIHHQSAPVRTTPGLLSQTTTLVPGLADHLVGPVLVREKTREQARPRERKRDDSP